jgi:hypothetical protein
MVGFAKCGLVIPRSATHNAAGKSADSSAVRLTNRSARSNVMELSLLGGYRAAEGLSPRNLTLTSHDHDAGQLASPLTMSA